MDIRKSWIATTPIAHRGFHTADLPENSIPAFENAIKHNYAIELDVRLIDDETVVVFHDDLLTRMSNTDGYVSSLKKEDLESHKLSKTEFSIPTFEKVLETVNGKTPILIELKNNNSAGLLETKIISMLASYNGDIAIQSFNPYSLEAFKIQAPQYLRGALSCFFRKQDMSSYIKRTLLKKLKLNKISKPDFISYYYENLPNKYVTKTELPVLAWTVRSNAEMEAALPYCDNIIFEKFTPLITKDEK